MAKIVLAGRSDCPYYARCELLGDRLAKNLKKFKLHKIVVQPEKWENWLLNTCNERGWAFSKSPIVWRELIDRGGKGVLIGDANDFQEYVNGYYGKISNMTNDEMLAIAAENKETKDRDDEIEEAYKALTEPIYVCITNAASPVCYHLLNSLSTGQILGPNTDVSFRLLVSSEKELELATAFAMEAEDLAHGVIESISVHIDPNLAFKDCSVIIFLDSIPRARKEAYTQWLEKNSERFEMYAESIENNALKTCKILVCGNGPLNFIAMLLAKHVSRIDQRNIVAVSTVMENYAKATVGEKLSVNPAGVVNLIVWGCLNESCIYDLTYSRVFRHKSAVLGPLWHSVGCLNAINSKEWVEKDFEGLVNTKEQRLTTAMGYTSGLSAARAVASILDYWYNGSPENEIISLGVCSQGWYNVPAGLYFSFPIRIESKESWHVVTDINISPATKEGISAAVKEVKTQWRTYSGEPETPDDSMLHTFPTFEDILSEDEDEEESQEERIDLPTTES